MKYCYLNGLIISVIFPPPHFLQLEADGLATDVLYLAVLSFAELVYF
jgi:hypothetical protein